MHTGQTANGFSRFYWLPRLMTDPYPPRVLGRGSGDTSAPSSNGRTRGFGPRNLGSISRGAVSSWRVYPVRYPRLRLGVWEAAAAMKRRGGYFGWSLPIPRWKPGGESGQPPSFKTMGVSMTGHTGPTPVPGQSPERATPFNFNGSEI